MKKTGRSREQAVAELSRHNPQGRLVTPAEVADTVLWLCGEGAARSRDRPSRWRAEKSSAIKTQRLRKPEINDRRRKKIP